MMPGSEQLPSKQIVLLGVGHTNAHIVRMWGMHPIPDVGLTCISDNTIATYSGMLPAVLAGQNSVPEMQIDLVKLCASVGARLIVDEVTGVDADRQLVHLADRPAIPFDVLSIGIGSVPSVQGVQIDDGCVLKIKPMQSFLTRLEQSVKQAVVKAAGRELRIVVAGSGVAGTEITFCLPEFLKGKTDSFSIQMVTRSNEILDGTIPSFRARVLAEMDRRNIKVSTGKTVTRVTSDGLYLNNGSLVAADLVIWATGASPPAVLEALDLPKDSRGFLATDTTLRSTSQKPVFAVGDTGTIVSEKLPKAGVYAVRQGPILWDNIKRLLTGKSLTEYQPQRSFLKLLNTGDGSAIGEFRGFSFSGRWVKKWKDRIDGRFMIMYRPIGMKSDAAQMPCRGCGCKLGGDVLEAVVQQVTATKDSDEPSRGLDDAAVIRTRNGGTIIASTDFFSSPFDDAYLSGRVAALHSASDLIAMGADVKAVLANVVLPEGDSKSQRQVFEDLMAGAQREFEAMGARIVGGHTIVGPRLELGFSVVGEPVTDDTSRLLCKGNLQTGDHLYVTKPLGVGVLLAAHMQIKCAAADYECLIATMLKHQQDVALLAMKFGVTAATDVTGFGLVGHLIEMLKASGRTASLQLDRIPLLPGAAVAFTQGIESTLAPGNRHIEHLIRVSDVKRRFPEYKALFDPQTCGGLLLAVPAKQSMAFEAAFVEDNFLPVRIGVVDDQPNTVLVRLN